MFPNKDIGDSSLSSDLGQGLLNCGSLVSRDKKNSKLECERGHEHGIFDRYFYTIVFICEINSALTFDMVFSS